MNSSTIDSDLQIILRQQVEEIARRNSDHKKYAQVHDRTQVIYSTLLSFFINTIKIWCVSVIIANENR